MTKAEWTDKEILNAIEFVASETGQRTRGRDKELDEVLVHIQLDECENKHEDWREKLGRLITEVNLK